MAVTLSRMEVVEKILQGSKYISRAERDVLWETVNEASVFVAKDSQQAIELRDIVNLLRRPIQQLRHIRKELRIKLLELLRQINDHEPLEESFLIVRPADVKASTTWVPAENPDPQMMEIFERLEKFKINSLVKYDDPEEGTTTIFVEDTNISDARGIVGNAKNIKLDIMSPPILESQNESCPFDQGSAGFFFSTDAGHFVLTARHNADPGRFIHQSPQLDLGYFSSDQDHRSLFAGTSCKNFVVDSNGRTLTLVFPEFTHNAQGLSFLISQGASVYKIGTQTGLTIGKFMGARQEVNLENGSNYKNVILVESDDLTQFTTFGDSGSVYFVRCVNQLAKFSGFVPIAIHLARAQMGQTRVSMGVAISEAITWIEKFRPDEGIYICDETCFPQNEDDSTPPQIVDPEDQRLNFLDFGRKSCEIKPIKKKSS